MSARVVSPDRLRMITRVLTLYYEQELRQSEIADSLGLSLPKVNRLIKQGRELGMVRIRIISPLSRLFEFEQALIERWGLTSCVVVPGVVDDAKATLVEVGRAAAELLVTTLKDGDTIAISGGKALSALILNIAPSRAFDVTVVPLTGGVQGQQFTDVNHLTIELAARLSGRATLLHAPLHAESAAERDMLMAVKSVRDVMDVARRATVGVVGIGAVSGPDSTYYQANPSMSAEREALYRAGVRSEFLAHLIDGQGRLFDEDHNARLVALSPDEVARFPTCIAVASGVEKREPVLAALRGGYFDSFVTDEHTACAVLEQETDHG